MRASSVLKSGRIPIWNQLLLFSQEDPNDKAHSNDDDGVIEKHDGPVDKDMALGPIAEIHVGGGHRPTTHVPGHLFHGGVGVAIGWGHLATIADLPGSVSFQTETLPNPPEYPFLRPCCNVLLHEAAIPRPDLRDSRL
jgi:hypothetical protein